MSFLNPTSNSNLEFVTPVVCYHREDQGRGLTEAKVQSWRKQPWRWLVVPRGPYRQDTAEEEIVTKAHVA